MSTSSTLSAPSHAGPSASSNQLASTTLEQLWFGEDDPDDARDRARASFAAQIALVRGLRPFPVAAGRLIELLGDSDFDDRLVVRTLESDPALTARTLTLANSALFRRSTPCTSIADALRRLGSRNVREIAIGVAAMSMFADAGGVGVAIRDHSVGVAAILRTLSDAVVPAESSTLFLTGLLHDVGKLLLVQTSELDYDSPRAIGMEPHLFEREALGFDHAVLGCCALRMWRIPEAIADTVAWHHQPSRALQMGGLIGLRVTLLRIADRIEALLASDQELDADAFLALARDGDCSYAELSAADLRGLWPALRDARVEALGNGFR